jgi:hypothetical protein
MQPPIITRGWPLAVDLTRFDLLFEVWPWIAAHQFKPL